jgi:hypothetical protein
MREKVYNVSRSMKVKATVSAVVAAALLTVTPYSNAQRAPIVSEKVAQNEIKTNLPEVTTKVGPPDTFNPLTASDEDLAKFGFPPKPKKDAAPKAFASWAKAVQAPQHRIVPQLEHTEIHHGPANGVKAGPSNGFSYSYNWSGFADFNSSTSWWSNNAMYFVYAEFEVPVAQQAFGACNGYWDYGSSWVGIDDGPDVLQAGIEYDALCYYFFGSPVRSQFYSPWFEWYPNGSYRINNLPIAPGDEIFVEVWSTSPTYGHAYLLNYSTNSSVSVDFYAPYGTSLIGNVAEWVVERPEVGGSLATLTNYVTDYFSDAGAYDFSYNFYEPGSAGAWQFDMLDNSGYVISYPTLLGPDSIRFQDANSARYNGAP